MYVDDECSDEEMWSSNATWYNGKDAFLQGLVGKTKDDIEKKLTNNNTATGSDVVTGASLSSNKVLKAVLAAFDA